eukprot:TRINITY_DN10853_c0_g1_i2.p1 TRINITY_DN10853_c0_g1~~TRINITY_DN10853_c0_g1_i2.p1  ORF type:complete len:325 (+),score=111.33 TRINITY_DN10853_c0_g1_i2:108-977(+)
MSDVVGFIGLGIMGEGMVRNLAKGGCKLIVWNRTPAKSEELKKEYPEQVEVAASVGDVVKGAGVTFSMLSNLEASQACFDSVLEAVGEGKSIVDCATLTPAAMQDMAAKVAAKGGRFVEAPVSGTKKPAADGQLIFLCAGSKSLFEDVGKHLDMMGKAKHYYGEEVGGGTKMKLAINMTMGTMMVAVSEGIALAESSNLTAADFLQVISEGAMGCPLYNYKAPNLTTHNHPPAFPLKHAHKDMNFALDLAAAQSTSLPVSAAAQSRFAQVPPEDQDKDFTVVTEVCRKL